MKRLFSLMRYLIDTNMSSQSVTTREDEILKSQFVTSSWGGQRYLPYAFTEHGVVMLASLFNTKSISSYDFCTKLLHMSKKSCLFIAQEPIRIFLKKVKNDKSLK